MEINEILKFVNGTVPPPLDKRKWVEECDHISFHAYGIRPLFYNVRHNTDGRVTSRAQVIPANYEKRYQYLIDDYILNRHPNEQWEHYQWRLSTFPLVAEEAYLNAERQILGSIYQNSQYTIEAENEDDQDYLDEIDFYKWVKYIIPRHIFTDPYGKIAIVEGHWDEFTENEQAEPVIKLVESRHILHFKPNEELYFQCSEKHNGRKVFYWIDREVVVRLVEDNTRNKDKVIENVYVHNIGYLPVIDNDTHFFKPFVSRADMLCRNMSDDEVITKNASYPHISMYSNTCTVCAGGGVIHEPCETGICNVPCRNCDGKGTVSVNPGEITLVPRPEMVGQNEVRDIPQQKRFDNPDISINEHSLKRVQWLEDKLLRSMNMRQVDEPQSGTAKAWDWQPMFFMLTVISEKLFEVDEQALFYILAYRNPNSDPQYKVERPTSFKIKTESELQAELKELQSSDVYVRRQAQDDLKKTTLTGDALGLKKWEIVKYWDFLWGMNDAEITNAKYVAGMPPVFFVRHYVCDNLIAKLEESKGYVWLLDTPLDTISAELDKLVKPFIPKSAIETPDVREDIIN